LTQLSAAYVHKTYDLLHIEKRAVDVDHFACARAITDAHLVNHN